MAARSLPPVSAPDFRSPDPGASAKTLADRVPPGLDPGRHALFLDFDGTFVDFAPTPDSVELRPGSKALLERLSRRLGGARSARASALAPGSWLPNSGAGTGGSDRAAMASLGADRPQHRLGDRLF